MAGEKETRVEQEQLKARPCPKDCILCSMRQHAYCAAQMSFYIVERINEIQMQILDLQKDIEKLKLDNEKELINPIESVNE